MDSERELNWGLVGAVVIGRNEGGRLVTCLQSLKNQISKIVYVDSGSTDESLNAAKQLSVLTVSLDMNVSFTAARARNAGASYLLAEYPEVEYIQFIDGDCELQIGWLNPAYKFLDTRHDYAVTCGRRRERFPEQSVYNQLCDIEWSTPVGEALACGGDALVRVSAYLQVNGYRDELIAGEEPEMCFRLRQLGWKICRLDVEMTLHDVGMTKLSQWWLRAKRAGYAYATSFALHGSDLEKFRQREVVSIMFWGGFMPLIIIWLIFIEINYMWSILLYVVQFVRISLKSMPKMRCLDAQLYSLFTVLAKFPQFMGVMAFYFNKITNKKQQLIEYK